MQEKKRIVDSQISMIFLKLPDFQIINGRSLEYPDNGKSTNINFDKESSDTTIPSLHEANGFDKIINALEIAGGLKSIRKL